MHKLCLCNHSLRTSLGSWVAHLIQAGMRSTHSPYAVSSRVLILDLHGRVSAYRSPRRLSPVPVRIAS